MQKVDVIMDRRAQNVKGSIKDLRNVRKLLEKHKLPLQEWINVSQSKAVLSKGACHVQLTSAEIPESVPRLSIYRNCPWGGYFWLLKLGMIDIEVLLKGSTPTVTEIEVDGKKLVRVESAGRSCGVNLKTTIEVDPAFGYRFTHIERRRNDILLTEYIAGDYKVIDEVPFPSFHIHRIYDVENEGKILKERKHVFEQVEFGKPVGDEDFKIFVPAGTEMMEYAVGKSPVIVKDGGYRGIDDFVGG
jgi:hypothetical protein